MTRLCLKRVEAGGYHTVVTYRPTFSQALARGVGRLRTRSGPSKIDRVRLIRYVGPGRAFRRSYGLIVGVQAFTPAGTVEGLGESIASSGQVAAAWRTCKKLASPLLDVAVPREIKIEDPLGDFQGWSLPEYDDRPSRRAAKLAIEMALLDLAWKLHTSRSDAANDNGSSLAAARQPLHRIPAAQPGSNADLLTPLLRADPGTSWAMKLNLTGDDAVDLEWLSHVLSLEAAAGRERPIWLTGGKRTPTAAGDFIRGLARVANELGQRRLLLEEPVSSGKSTAVATGNDELEPAQALPRLQWLADEVMPTAAGEGRRVLIVAGDSVRHGRQLNILFGRGAVGGVHLLPGVWGTVTGLLAAAQAVKGVDESTLVILGGGRGSRLGSVQVQRVAEWCPEVDVLSISTAVGWPTLLVDDSAPGVHAPGGSDGLDWDELAAFVEEVVTIPDMAPAASAAYNRYPDHPLHKAKVPARSLLLETEALRLGMQTRRFSPWLFLAEDTESGISIGFSDSESSATSFAATRVALHKGATRTLLANRGLPIAEGSFHLSHEANEALAAGVALGFPLVVKPGGGSMGAGITTGVSSADALAKALREVATSSYADTGIVVERYVVGNDHRILVTRDEVVSVVRRDPASVVGDGWHTIEQLIILANAARRQNPHIAKRPIPLDQRIDDYLRRRSLTRHTVPAPSERVQVRAEANLHQGGESSEVLDSTHPTILKLAVDAIRSIPGLTQAGVDVLLEDHRLAVDEQQIAIIEVNSRPVQTLHHFTMFGPARNVSAKLVGEAASAAGVPPRETAETLTVRLHACGRVQRVGYRKWFASAADELGLVGWVSNSVDLNEVTALIQGPPDAVGILVRLAFDGPATADVVETYAKPEGPISMRGFTIRHDAGEAAEGAS